MVRAAQAEAKHIVELWRREYDESGQQDTNKVRLKLKRADLLTLLVVEKIQPLQFVQCL